ncbi:serine/threonine-protein kinase greatwall-like [Diaphorina citri]|uniref:Serine/threonine-protein kinase greatwall n=1 Tax=Diaphorina citri TaxID=121845 RepID=A0A1S3CV55_DIACI|nr:serine/threonine-protein kinase greatwall-like [Diaphorina citri]
MDSSGLFSGADKENILEITNKASENSLCDVSKSCLKGLSQESRQVVQMVDVPNTQHIHKCHVCGYLCSGVDWWALGVCIYEFVTGVLPFSDETPQKVFDNILANQLEWPEDEEALNPSTEETILALLKSDPTQRPSGHQVRRLPMFKDYDWDSILDQEPPFVPQPDDVFDTSYFHAKNNLQQLVVSNCDICP